MFKYIWDVLVGTGTQLRSLAMVFSHGFRKRDTLQYPEEAVYLPPRYRGRIVLTRDPDGEERCVACNLCAVACPVGCISLQKAETPDGRWYPDFFRINFSRCIFCGLLRGSLPDHRDPADAGTIETGRVQVARIWSTRRNTCRSAGPGKYHGLQLLPHVRAWRSAGKPKGAAAERDAEPVDVKSLLP